MDNTSVSLRATVSDAAPEITLIPDVNDQPCLDVLVEFNALIEAWLSDVYRDVDATSIIELEARAFIQRTAIFLRVQLPLKWGRGYGARSQPFALPDLEVWRKIRLQSSEVWSDMLGDEVDPLVFVNHRFDVDLSWSLLDEALNLSFRDSVRDAVSDGGATLLSASLANMGMLDASGGVHLSKRAAEWSCLLCKDVNGDASVDRLQSLNEHRFRRDDFCIRCSTLYCDSSVWLCRGSGTHRCNAVLRMKACTLGVPICTLCKTVRHQFQTQEVFESWCMKENDEPNLARGLTRNRCA